MRKALTESTPTARAFRSTRRFPGSGSDMKVEDLADHDPLARDLQQMEEISEAEPGDIVGVNAGAGGSADDLDADDGGLSFRRRTEVRLRASD